MCSIRYQPKNKFPSAEVFFKTVIANVKIVIMLGVILLGIGISFLPSFIKDVRFDEFLDDDNSAILHKNKVKEIFGLNGPMVVVLVNDSEQGVFNPRTLALVDRSAHQSSRDEI